ncbi:unnamed protein product, partial [marine sediment metagenome]
MQRDKECLLDILEAAKLALTYVAIKTKEDFLKDIQCQDAVIRRLEIIGEAAGRISEETRNAFPRLPWSEMVGMRNIMIHDYDDVDIAIVWETVQN